MAVTKGGKKKQNIFCKQKQKGEYTNYSGSVTIGGKIYLIGCNPEVSEGRNGNSGVWVTMVGPYTESDFKKGF